jgi:hypothetical protein
MVGQAIDSNAHAVHTVARRFVSTTTTSSSPSPHWIEVGVELGDAARAYGAHVQANWMT